MVVGSGVMAGSGVVVSVTSMYRRRIDDDSAIFYFDRKLSFTLYFT